MDIKRWFRRKIHITPATAGLIARTGNAPADGSKYGTRVRYTKGGGVDMIFAPPEDWPDRDKVWEEDQRKWEAEDV